MVEILSVQAVDEGSETRPIFLEEVIEFNTTLKYRSLDLGCSSVGMLWNKPSTDE